MGGEYGNELGHTSVYSLISTFSFTKSKHPEVSILSRASAILPVNR